MGFINAFKRRPDGYQPIHRLWPRVSRKATWYLMPLELIGLIPALVIFGISQPDLYRTDLWGIGFANKLNSDPNMIIYAYANHRPLPTVPLVWSRTLTNFNVAISIISLFFLLAKLISFIMKVWYPIFATFVNFALVALYATSTYGQIGPDHADSRYPANAAWYLTWGCDLAKPWGKYKSCRIAQGSLAISAYMLAIYTLNLGFSAYALWPNPENDIVEDEEEEAPVAEAKPANWEMQSIRSPLSARSMPYTPNSPFTPRTQAFGTLDRQLPLRQQMASYR